MSAFSDAERADLDSQRLGGWRLPGRTDEQAPQSRPLGASATAKKQAPGVGHRGLETRLPDVDIRHAQGVALLT